LAEERASLITFAGTMYVRLPVVHEAAEVAVLPDLVSLLQKNVDDLRADPDEFRRSLERCAAEFDQPDILRLQPEDLDPDRFTFKLNREHVIDGMFRTAT